LILFLWHLVMYFCFLVQILNTTIGLGFWFFILFFFPIIDNASWAISVPHAFGSL